IGHINLLAALGQTKVQRRRRPTVGLIATGSELREAGQPLRPGQIYESNRVGLALLAAGAGAIPKIYPLVEDRTAATDSALGMAPGRTDRKPRRPPPLPPCPLGLSRTGPPQRRPGLSPIALAGPCQRTAGCPTEHTLPLRHPGACLDLGLGRASRRLRRALHGS